MNEFSVSIKSSNSVIVERKSSRLPLSFVMLFLWKASIILFMSEILVAKFCSVGLLKILCWGISLHKEKYYCIIIFHSAFNNIFCIFHFNFFKDLEKDQLSNRFCLLVMFPFNTSNELILVRNCPVLELLLWRFCLFFKLRLILLLFNALFILRCNLEGLPCKFLKWIVEVRSFDFFN